VCSRRRAAAAGGGGGAGAAGGSQNFGGNDFKLSVKKFKYQHRQTCSIKLCKICIQRLHGLDLFLGPFQLLEALSLVLIGCSFWVQRNLPPKKRKENCERERERDSSPKQGYSTVMSRSNPPTNSSVEQMAES
jgi:hypothetical protein